MSQSVKKKILSRVEKAICTIACMGIVTVQACNPVGGNTVTSQETDYPERPNIVWISTEDISPLLGAYGDTVVNTPVLDQLASDGVRFTKAFSTAGVCAPSRAAIITGMHQSSIGAHQHRTTSEGPGMKPYLTVPPTHVKAFTEYLRAAGYYTTNKGKTDYQFAPHSDNNQPISAWDETGANAHWRNAPEGQPFFSVFNFMTTHESQVWPNPKRPVTVDPDLVEVPPYYADTPIVRRDIAQQYSNIERMDAQVGRILNQLEKDGLAENTVVFFWSDHGGALPRQKRAMYDSGIHVPVIIRWPGVIEPGSVDDEMMSFVDLAPTVLSIAGVDVPAHMQGRALYGSQKQDPPEYIFAARDRHDEDHDMVRAVRDKRYKYIRNYFPNEPYSGWVSYENLMPIKKEMLRLHAEGKLDSVQSSWIDDARPVHELYDLIEDPHEINNLAKKKEYKDTRTRMSKALDQWMTEIDDMGFIPEDQMAETFWPGNIQPQTNSPFFVVNSEEEREREWLDEGGKFTIPYTVSLISTTDGASIVYTTDEGDNPHWKLYTSRINITNPVKIRARAIRYGYAESEETEGDFDVN
ncbi:MAG: sulfatase-like hydrolase/transferase [Balneolales bacterium]